MLQEDEKAKRKLELSCAEFNVVLDEGTMSSGQFSIKADSYVWGEIYSTDTRVRNIQKQFEGNSTIEVEINGKNLKKGDEIKGFFYLITNSGEYTLPFSVKVLLPVLESSEGEVVNLFHFTNLAKADWNEAVKLFYNPNFANIFTKKDQQLLSIYRGLNRQPGNENNVEEFLIAISKKLPIDYQLDTDGVILENVYSSIHEYIHVKKSNWGHTDLKVEKTGDFFTISHVHIGNEDFDNNTCTIDMYINASRLKPGMNIGSIHIYNSKTNLSIPVRISMESNKRTKKIEREGKLELQLSILDAYMNSKQQVMDADVKLTEVKKLVEEWLDEDEEAILAQLYKIQILLLEERFNEAKWLLDEIGHRLRKEPVDIATKCYYYYLTTLYNRDEEYLGEVIRAFENALYKDKKQWRIALLLLQTNEEYSKNPDAKWEFIKEQCDNGCISPLLYNEAFSIILDNPSKLIKLEEFEQQVVWYGAKRKLLSKDLRDQVVYLAGKVSGFSVILFEILQSIYEKQPTEQALTAICRILIMGCKNNACYFKWYKQAVDRGIRLAGLYEYYMYTLDTSVPFEIPRILLLYFSYQSQLDADKKAVLYKYIIEHSEEETELINTYETQIERFVLDQIREGRVSKDLAFLYENVVGASMLRDDTAYFFTPLLFMHEITIENPNITSVVLIHDRMKGESIYPIKDFKCQIPVYSEDYMIFLQDNEGNRYVKSISYKNEQLVDYTELLENVGECLEGRTSYHFYLCEQDKNIVSVTKHNFEGIKDLVDSELIIDSVKAELRTKLLHFYYDDDRIGELDTFLDEIDDEELDPSERTEFMRFLITRGKFDKAYLWLKKYGAQGVNQKNIARLVSKRIQSSEYMEDDFLINVAFYVFRKAKYDEATLIYLIKYYNGKIRDLRDIWIAASDLKLRTTPLEERMLRQMLLTNEIVSNKNDILLSYEDDEDHDGVLVEQYYENIANDYVLKNVLVENTVLEHLYLRAEKKEVSKTQKLAILKFIAEEKNSSLEVNPEIVEMLILDFYNENKYFAFFKELTKFCSKLHFMQDRYYIQYQTGNRCDHVKLHYVYGESVSLENLDDEDEAYKTDDMIMMYEGIYVKECTLFAGEILQYYISEESAGESTITYSDTLKCDIEAEQVENMRYARLNDIVVSMELEDDMAANDMLKEYLYQDYCARDLFRMI